MKLPFRCFGKTRGCGWSCREVPWLISVISLGLGQPGPPTQSLPNPLWVPVVGCSTAGCQCLCFLEQRLLKECKFPFIALRNFVICVLELCSRGREARELFVLQEKPQECPSAAGWVPAVSPWSSNSEERREGGKEGKSHARGLEGEELNSQNTSHLVVVVWEQELPLVPGLYLLTNSSQRLQHSQRGRRVSRAVLGRCWLRLICFVFFFLCCNWVFPPIFQEGNNVPYLSCTPDH